MFKFKKQTKTSNETSTQRRIYSWKDLRNPREPKRTQYQRTLTELKKMLGEIKPKESKKKKNFNLNFKLNFKNLAVAIRDHWQLVIESAAQNQLRIQELKRNPVKGEACSLNFNSYSELKKYQKKVRLFTFSVSSTLASALVVAILLQIVFPGKTIQGATYHFQQTNWTTQTANVAAHPANQTSWTEYSAKDSGIVAVNGGNDIQLQQISSSAIQTSDTDFAAGTNTNTAVAGTGDAGSVGLQKLETAGAWTRMADTVTVPTYGNDLTYDNNGNLYQAIGGSLGMPNLFKYSIASNSWTNLAYLPLGTGNGRSLVYASNGYIYSFAGGNSNAFYRYDIAANSWSAMTTAPGGIAEGGGLTYDGNGNVFAFQGGTNAFWKYAITSNSWTVMATAPATAGAGSSLTYAKNGFIYAMAGSTFAKYEIATNTWTTLTGPGTSGSITYDNNGNIYHVGVVYSGSTPFKKYSIAAGTWTTLTVLPGGYSSRPRIAYDNDGHLFVVKSDPYKEFYKFSLYDNYQSSGTFESGVIDLGAKGNLTGLSYDLSVPIDGAATIDLAAADSPSGPWNFVPSDEEVLPENAVVGWVRQDCTGYSNCYTSLDAWSRAKGGIDFGSCTAGNLICANKIAVAKIDGTWTSPDTTNPTFAGWVTGPYNYAKIFTTSSARHQGKLDGSKYLLQVPDTAGSLGIPAYTKLSGIQYNRTGGGSGFYNPNYTEISNCIFKYSGTSTGVNMIQTDSGGKSFKIWNNYFINGSIYIGGQAITAYSNTFYGGSLNQFAGGKILAIDNIVQGVTDGYMGTSFVAGSDYNISNVVGDAPGANSKNGVTVQFVDPANGDFRLADTDTVARDAGTDLSANATLAFANDIAGSRRSGTWDIGAHEYGAVSFLESFGAKRYVKYRVNFSGSGNRWVSSGTMPGISSNGAMVYGDDGNIYIAQGYNGSSATNVFWKYNINTKIWSTLAPMPGNTNSSSMVYDNKGGIYVNQGYDGSTYSNAFWKYDIASNTWNVLASMPGVSGDGGMAVGNDGKIYASQGYDGAAATNVFWKYDIETNVWSVLASMPGVSRYGGLIFNEKGSVYAIQGNSSTGFWKYDIAANTWSSLTNVPASYSSGGFIYDKKGNVYVNRGNNSNLFWKYDVAANNWIVLDSMAMITSGNYFAFDDSGIIYSNQAYNGANHTDWFLKYATRVDATPVLSDLTINYQSYPSSATLTSSPYNSNDAANILAKMQWTENNPTGSDTTFQVRTSPDNVAWTDWVGPDGTSATSFTDPTGAETMPTLVSDGANDKYMQYKVTLASDGTVTPTLSDADVTYVVNAPPELQNIIASQGSDGIVNVSYEVRDPDTTTGAVKNKVNVVLEYCTANCLTPGSETWVAATTTSGDIGSEVSVEETAFAAKTIQWTAKTDYPNQYKTDLKVRVTANDGEAANNIARATSTAFVLDTKDPANVSVVIDHTKSSNQLTLTTPTEDSTYQMLVSSYADFRDATYEAFQTQKTLTLSNDPVVVYLRIKDAKGNVTTASATTPINPQNVVYFDVSNATTNEWREFIAWSVPSLSQVGAGFGKYEIYRSTDNSTFTKIAEQLDRSANFYMDNGLVNTEHYYYKVLAKDINGNTSNFSNTVDDVPNGQGGSDTTAPTITDVSIQNVAPTSATIVWNTDELSDSSVGYSTDTTYLPEYGVGSMVTNHAITLSGLVPETTYHIRVKSRDLLNNLGQVDENAPGANSVADFVFTTLAGPKISQVTVSEINNNDATVTWQTDVDATSIVRYSDTVSSGTLVNAQSTGSASLTKTHQVKIANLTENMRYYFELESQDTTGNKTIDNNAGAFFELLTTQDSLPPEIQNLTTSYVSFDTAVISFVTDEPAKTTVEYGKSDFDLSQAVTSFDRSHYLILPGLEADQDYQYRVKAQDINGNSVTSDTQKFTTLKNPEFSHDPLSKIENIRTSVVTDSEAVLAFETDQNANCLVEFGTDENNLSGTPVKEGENVFNRTHALHLMGLVFNTKYAYKLTCQDNLETVVESDMQSFITKEKALGEGDLAGMLDQVAPTVSNVKVTELTGESATIEWETDENGSSMVRYGLDSNYGSMAGDDAVNNDKAKYSKVHKVVLNNLVPGMRYLFRASSLDASGNIGEAGENNFTTKQSSTLSSIRVVSEVLGGATVMWNSSASTTSVVEYGLNENYGEKKESNTLAKEHRIELTSLNQGETYHLRVKGKDEKGIYYSSQDYTFEPKSPPKILDINISDVTEHGAKISFKTNVPTDANVTYTDVQNPKVTGSQGTRDLTVDHSIELGNLAQGTTFSLIIEAKDEQGTNSSENGPDFTTGRDENPPKIDQVRTDSALTQSDKVQTIINWKTDEQATTSILYKEGRNAEEKELKITENFTTGHVAVITSFKPGAVYYFKAKSIDASGNTSVSNEFAMLTPKRKENIIQVIINNFQDIFGWARR